MKRDPTTGRLDIQSDGNTSGTEIVRMKDSAGNVWFSLRADGLPQFPDLGGFGAGKTYAVSTDNNGNIS